jgi:hypothetical protein
MRTTKRTPPNAGKGHPKGALNKTTREAPEFCAGVVDDPEYQATVRRRALEGTLSPTNGMHALVLRQGKAEGQCGRRGNTGNHSELERAGELMSRTVSTFADRRHC